MKVLANDGISASGVDALEAAGHEVILTTVAQDQLEAYLNEHKIDVLLVRSATKVRQALIDAVPSLKIIGRGGVGMDNIDVQYARDKGLHVINTPAASSNSVAELVFAHLFGSVRFLHDSNRNMPLDGDTKFKQLKKAYAAGQELRGKTLGIIGFGRIGQAVARIAIGVGMHVMLTDHNPGDKTITLEFATGDKLDVKLDNHSQEDVLSHSDFVTIHIPAQNGYVIGKKELNMMKDGAGLINAARGGVVDEVALIDALTEGKLAFAALDVFENEPTPAMAVLMNHSVSLSPHIGAATNEAQDRIGVELAEQIDAIAKG